LTSRIDVAQHRWIAVKSSENNHFQEQRMKTTRIAVDIGMSNIDLVVEERFASEGPARMEMHMLENKHELAVDQVRQALAVVGDSLRPDALIGVTGGHYRDLPDFLDGYRLHKVDEMCALGWGGLAAANKGAGLVVSAGTGTAMVAARGDEVSHVTGSAVGGGTLLGLSRLILNTVDVHEIDRLALAGDAAAVDIMLTEAVGGEVGRLPANANAVNLGKLMDGNNFRHEDLAAGLVRLVAQVIAVIAINAANAVGMAEIILIGHTMDLVSVQKEIAMVGEFYQREFIMPRNPGFATAMGVLGALRKR
jgi:type II pantothenate kinase